MTQWTRICCAIDGSEASQVAVEAAAALARRLGAMLHLVHVRRGIAFAGAPFAPPPPPRSARNQEAEASQVSSCLSRARGLAPGLVKAVERTGDPATEIVAYAREASCDVIVVGTHARQGIKRLLLGSVAAVVVRTAGRPVLVVPIPVMHAAGIEPRSRLLLDEPSGSP